MIAVRTEPDCLSILQDEHLHIFQYCTLAPALSYKDILESEIIEDGSTITKTSRNSKIGGALLGGVIAGGVGVLIGGLSGSNFSKHGNQSSWMTKNYTACPRGARLQERGINQI